MSQRNISLLQELEERHLAELKELQNYERIPDSLMQRILFPPSWRKRERPPKLWDHIISLPDAFEATGKALFGNLWQGNSQKPVEWHARHEAAIRLWDEKESHRYSSILCAWQGWQSCDALLSKAIDFHGNTVSENSAYERKDAVYKTLITWLNTEKITAFTVTENGECFPIPAHQWLRPEAFSILEWGRTTGTEKEHEIGSRSQDYEALYLDNARFLDTLSEISENHKKPTIDSTSRGRREKYSWDEFHAALTKRIHDEGVPETQAELERYMADWCINTWTEQPTESVIRQKISSTYKALKSEK